MAAQTNPFDQFDAAPPPPSPAAANPFDEFDSTSIAPTPAPSAPAPSISSPLKASPTANPFAQLQKMLDSGASKQQFIAKAKELGFPTVREDVLDANLAYRARGGRARITPEIVTPDNSLNQWAGVATNALAPYATAFGLGAAAGGIPTGGIGAPAGGALGVMGLGLGDLGTALVYNPVLNAFGYKSAPLPSDLIRQGYRSVGIGTEPQTAPQRIFGAGLEGAAGAAGGASGANTLARMVTNPTARGVLTTMAEAPLVQTASGAGAAVGGQTAREAGAGTGGQIAASILGGLAGGRMAAPRPTEITSDMLRTQARAAYTTAENAGVAFAPLGIDHLASQVRADLTGQPNVQFHPRLHPRIAAVVDELDTAAARANQTGQPVSFSELELLRRLASTAGRSADADERRLSSSIIEQIDNFVQAPPANAVAGGNAPQAAHAVVTARDAWRRMSQADQIDTLVENARLSAGEGDAASIRNQFRTVARNPARLRRFDPEIQTVIRDIAAGRGGVATLQRLGKLAPSLDLRRLGTLLTAGGAEALREGNTSYGALALGLSAGGAAARTAANRMAAGRAAQAASRARGTQQFQMPLAPTALGATNAMLTTNPNTGFPEIDPMTGETLIDIGNFEGQLYPIYGRPEDNPGGSLRARSARR
jgi:hypothetical protein